MNLSVKKGEIYGLIGRNGAGKTTVLRLISGLAKGISSKSYITELLESVGLSATDRKKVKHFSAGMKQRLGIALALVGNPELVLLDEPINGLDPQGMAEIREMITKLNRERGITFIISSHILGELSKIATSYGIIEKGELKNRFWKQNLQKI